MSRSPEHYDSSRKKFIKKKKKRFERPRFRSPQVEDSPPQVGRQNVKTCEDSRTDEISAYTDAASDCQVGDNPKIWEETSSTYEEFFDALESKGVDDWEEQEKLVTPPVMISVRMKLEGSKMAVLVEDGRGRRRLEIPEEDLVNDGIGWNVTRLLNDSLAVDFHPRQYPEAQSPQKVDRQAGDGLVTPSKTTAEAQTSIVLGVDEISETEDTSIMTCHSRVPRRMNAIMEEVEEKTRDLSPPSEAFMVSETSDDILNSFDSTPVFKSTIKNTSVVLEEKLKKPRMKPMTDSTVSSIPLDTVTSETRRDTSITPDTSVLEDLKINENSQSYVLPYFPPVKSKSDSLVVSDRKKTSRRKFNHEVSEVLVRNDANPYPDMLSVFYNKTEDEWQYSEGHQLSAYCCSKDWDNDKSTQQPYDEEKSECDVEQLLEEQFRHNEEAQERPMTSAADAVKSMHQALKPINDQINDIRSKMIGMNIQPRSTRQKFGHHFPPPLPPERGHCPSKSVKINRWLLTDPQQFSSTVSRSDAAVSSPTSLRTCDMFADDLAFNGVTPQTFRPNKVVIFPAHFNNPPDSSYAGASNPSNLEDLSYLSRSSIVTEPEDLFSEADRVTWPRREDRL